MFTDVIYPEKLPWIIQLLGGRWREKEKTPLFRMKWGQLGFEFGLALELCLFREQGFVFHWHALWIDIFLNLGFLDRFAWDPEEIMEGWGVTLFDGAFHFHWGTHVMIWRLPWRDWVQTKHEVRRIDGSWVPYVPEYEPELKPDLRYIETYPYRYVLRSGEIQERTADIYVERRTRKLRWLRWLPWGSITYAIDVTFSDEVGEASGSWKGGTIGCGYTIRPDETARECLKRMERERKF